MSAEPDGSRRYERYAVGAALLLLVIGCYFVIRPFLTAFIWGSIISLSTRGIYRRILGWVRGRKRLAATLCSLALVVVLLAPITALAMNVVTEMPNLTSRFQQMLDGGLQQPPAWLAGVPLVGKATSAKWQAFAADPEALRQALRPYLKPVKDFLATAVGGVSVGLLEFALALLIAGMLYVRGDRFAATVDQIARRLGGETGHRQVMVVRSTVKSVFNGMLGTCAVQAILALIGFWIAGVPQPFLLGMGTFFLSFVPGGPTVLWLPAALWLNANGSTGWAIFMAVWGLVVVGGADNVVRPLLIGRGVEAPMALIFLGVIGGLLSFGFLGLFIGPTLLVVAHNLFQDWMNREAPPAASVPKVTA
jgi:predicted PurR-regulated permease PerM